MGASRTPTFAVRVHVPGEHWTPLAWSSRHFGRPSDETLATFVETIESDTGITVARATVTRQNTGETVARYSAPAFRAVTENPGNPLDKARRRRDG